MRVRGVVVVDHFVGNSKVSKQRILVRYRVRTAYSIVVRVVFSELKLAARLVGSIMPVMVVSCCIVAGGTVSTRVLDLLPLLEPLVSVLFLSADTMLVVNSLRHVDGYFIEGSLLATTHVSNRRLTYVEMELVKETKVVAKAVVFLLTTDGMGFLTRLIAVAKPVQIPTVMDFSVGIYCTIFRIFSLSFRLYWLTLI